MKVCRHVPKYPLSEFIQHIMYVNGSLPLTYLKEIPTGCINLVIELNENTVNTIYSDTNLQNKFETKHAWISGMQKQAVVYKNNPNSTIISVRFKVGGFFSLTNTPIPTLCQAGINAESVLGNSFQSLYQQLVNSKTHTEIFDYIEEYFLQFQKNSDSVHNVVKFIDLNIERPINWLIQKTGYSQKHIISMVKKNTGYSLKYLKRINRFYNVVNDIQRNKQCIDWFAIIHRYGFYDQAHFIKDFTHFSGIKPTEYLNSQLALEENSLVPDMILRLPPS